ncbi:MAG: hypothetical protein KatS3mg023_3468 [Armatimonadota bacterium]|nr:MAG: hypothetical protein KatS3mg023_3468 [Armatimonadota bacterium]
MSTEYVEPPDLSALEDLLQVERTADIQSALQHLYTTAGCEPLAVLALRYGFGYDLKTIAFIMNRRKSDIAHTLRECLQLLAPHVM